MLSVLTPTRASGIVLGKTEASLVPRPLGWGKAAWYPLHAHARKFSKFSVIIPVNRPESGRTVLTLTTVSCCPAEHSTCPEFIRHHSISFFCLEKQVTHTKRQDMHALSIGMLMRAVEIHYYYHGYTGIKVSSCGE